MGTPYNWAQASGAVCETTLDEHSQEKEEEDEKVVFAQHLRLWSLALCRSKLYYFEKNIGMFRPNLDMLIGVWGIPGKNQN